MNAPLNAPLNAALPIGQLLLDARLIGADQLRVALHEQQRRKRPLGQVLVELGFLSDTALRDALATHCGHASVDLRDTVADPAAVALIPQALATRHQLLALQFRAAERRLVVATAKINDLIALDRLQAELGPDIVLAAGGAIQGHPLGAAAGGRALRQAIDATMAGVPTDEYSTDHPELAAALAAFGYQPPEWER